MRSLEVSEVSIVSGGSKKGSTKGTNGGAKHDDGLWHQIGGALADDVVVAAGIIGTVSGGGPVAGAATAATAYQEYQNETTFQRTFNKLLLDPFGTYAKALMKKNRS